MARDATEAAWDATLYAGSALVALVLPLATDAPLDRQWGAIALPGYAVGALGATLSSRRSASIRTRTLLAVGVFVAVAVVPLLVQADARIEGQRAPVKSDVLVVEEAAASLLDGRDPYSARFDGGLLRSWPEATRTHFPYLPATLAFGVPRAVFGASVWTDPRVLSLVVTLVVALPALAVARASAEGRLRAFQVLLVLASGAPLVFTSGKELPILALLLGSLVALDRDRNIVGGLAVGLAASAHQLAWAMLPFIAVAAWRRRVPPPHRAAMVVAGLTTVGLVAPFVAWNPAAFVEDAVRYPLGIDQPAGRLSITPGSILATSFPDARPWLVAALALALSAVTITLARKARRGSAADIAEAAGMLLLAALVLAPRVRIAYFVFPLNLLVWSRFVLSRAPLGSAASGPAPRQERAARRDREGDRREEGASPQRADERVGLTGKPHVEDQHDREEARVATHGGTDDAPQRARRRVDPAISAIPASDGPPPLEDHHRDEDHVRGDQGRKDGFEHAPSAPEEEVPSSDEQVPAEPEP
jgi:hypothetical protein